MEIKGKFFILLLAGSIMCGLSANAQKRAVVKPQYIFGFAISMTDSVAYITEVQRVDSAWVETAHGYLVDRALYSLQLQYYLEQSENAKNTVCSVFFNRNPRKMQRLWARMKRRYAKAKNLRFIEVPKSSFAFTAEEYKEIKYE